MTVEKTPNYTPAQEARLRKAAETNGTLNLALATELADEFGKKVRSVIAKINRMELPYARKVAVTKTGAPVESKAKIVAEIGTMVEGNLDGLEKASKTALQRVRDALAA